MLPPRLKRPLSIHFAKILGKNPERRIRELELNRTELFFWMEFVLQTRRDLFPANLWPIQKNHLPLGSLGHLVSSRLGRALGFSSMHSSKARLVRRRIILIALFERCRESASAPMLSFDSYRFEIISLYASGGFSRQPSNASCRSSQAH